LSRHRSTRNLNGIVDLHWAATRKVIAGFRQEMQKHDASERNAIAFEEIAMQPMP
jgi:hypothetical protein